MRWVVLVVLVASAAHAQVGRRWALVVGENHGTGGEETLRYAEDDAVRVRDVLVEVGGVAASDLRLLRGANAVRLREALKQLEHDMEAQPGLHDRLFVYVSGHAGDGVLHLDGTELALTELVDFVKAAHVEVGVLVVDACRSGAMTRLKGLKPTDGPPVRVEASGLQGRVLISASGADEYAQESESLKGSTFTHHFVTGLRGAADASRDGRVTLDEVYAWAWSRTLESTFGTRGGAQRPAFKVDLSGQGQLVLSEPGFASGVLTLAVEAPGRWLVVAAETNAVFAELDKPSGPMTLALPEGPYRVRLGAEKGALERAVIVPARGSAVVRGEELERASLQRIALKGAPESSITASAGAGIASGLVNGVSLQPGIELRVRFDDAFIAFLNEFMISGAARDARSIGTGFRQSEFELRAGAAHRFFISRLSVSIGLELGALLVSQNDIPAQPARTSVGPLAQLIVEARLPIIRPIELYVLGSGGGAVMKKMAGVAPIPRAVITGGVALVF